MTSIFTVIDTISLFICSFIVLLFFLTFLWQLHAYKQLNPDNKLNATIALVAKISLFFLFLTPTSQGILILIVNRVWWISLNNWKVYVTFISDTIAGIATGSCLMFQVLRLKHSFANSVDLYN